MGFLNSAHRGGSEKASFTMYLAAKTLIIFNSQKSAPSVPESIITDYWPCQLSLFPSPPPPSFGELYRPPPPTELKTRLPCRVCYIATVPHVLQYSVQSPHEQPPQEQLDWSCRASALLFLSVDATTASTGVGPCPYEQNQGGQTGAIL